MTVENDLFGGTRLVRIRERIGTRGCQQVNVHTDEGRAISALMEFAQKSSDVGMSCEGTADRMADSKLRGGVEQVKDFRWHGIIERMEA